MAGKTGRFAIIEQLLADDIHYMFGNPGTVEQGFLDALSDYPDFKYIFALQESVAVEAPHQGHHLPVGHRPHAGQHRPHPAAEEAQDQAEDLAAHQRRHRRGPAGAERHQVSVELPGLQNLRRREPAVVRLQASHDPRQRVGQPVLGQDQGRPQGQLVIQVAVGGKMEDAELP